MSSRYYWAMKASAKDQKLLKEWRYDFILSDLHTRTYLNAEIAFKSKKERDKAQRELFKYRIDNA